MRRFVAVIALVLIAKMISPNVLLAEELDYHITDPELKVVRLDSSPDASFLSVRTDSTGRIFVGGRKTLFAYDLDESGRYKPRQLLFEFPDHTWVNDIEIRGDDLYVVTVSAVYRIPAGRINRTNLKPERLLWGVPNGQYTNAFTHVPGGLKEICMSQWVIRSGTTATSLDLTTGVTGPCSTVRHSRLVRVARRV